MNILADPALLIIAALIAYIASPFAARWWRANRPTQCPACRTWTKTSATTFVRHNPPAPMSSGPIAKQAGGVGPGGNSGAHIRVCDGCYRTLYVPFSRKEDRAK